jgi:hypothetical protein
VSELAIDVGTSAACQALVMPRASYYWHRRKVTVPAEASPRPAPARALAPAERQTVLALLHEERFQNPRPKRTERRRCDTSPFQGKDVKRAVWRLG